MRYIQFFLAAIFLALVVYSCSHLKPTKLIDAKAACYAYRGPSDTGTCTMDQTRICDRFLNDLEKSANYEGCVAHCDEVNRQVMLDTSYIGCNAVRANAEWLCRDYCNDNYQRAEDR